MIRALSFITLLLVSSLTFATIDAYEFKNAQDEQRFRELTKELRCPKCQNQDIADSNAGLAKDIKDRAYELVGQGKSNQEIVDYMVDRYGEFITYRPRVRPGTWFLWYGPFVLALLAIVIILVRKLGQKKAPEPEVSAEQHARVQALLQQLEQTEQQDRPDSDNPSGHQQ